MNKAASSRLHRCCTTRYLNREVRAGRLSKAVQTNWQAVPCSPQRLGSVSRKPAQRRTEVVNKCLLEMRTPLLRSGGAKEFTGLPGAYHCPGNGFSQRNYLRPLCRNSDASRCGSFYVGKRPNLGGHRRALLPSARRGRLRLVRMEAAAMSREEIISANPIVGFLRGRGVKLKQKGGELCHISLP